MQKSDQKNFKDMKVGPVNILGSTTINHSARVALGLNCSEYVLMDYVYRCVQKKIPIDITDVYQKTGFRNEEQAVLLRNLVGKGFINPIDTPIPQITDKWATAFTDIQMEFEELFWKRNGKVFWTGSKKKSYDFYYKTRKSFSRDFLVGQRDEYARYLELENKRGFNRRVMMAERWLHPSNAYYDVDWKTMADDIQKELDKANEKLNKANQKAEKTQTLTAEERKKQYEQDSNQ